MMIASPMRMCCSFFAVAAAAAAGLGGGQTAGTGLSALWWEADLNSVDQIPGSAPSGTFNSTVMDYPAGEANEADDLLTPLAAFIAPDDGSLIGQDSSNMLDKAFAFRGRLAIEPGDDTDPGEPGIQVVFAIGSNDGSRMSVGCEVVVDNDGVRPFTVATGVHTFDEPGLHRVEIRFITNNNHSGIEWWSSIDGTPRPDAPVGTVAIVPTERLYPLEACTADLAAPLGAFDLADINAFVSGFVSQDPAVDQNGDCLFDLGDVNVFVTAFLAGCQ